MLSSRALVLGGMMDWGREWLKIIILWQSCESRTMRVRFSGDDTGTVFLAACVCGGVVAVPWISLVSAYFLRLVLQPFHQSCELVHIDFQSIHFLLKPRVCSFGLERWMVMFRGHNRVDSDWHFSQDK